MLLLGWLSPGEPEAAMVGELLQPLPSLMGVDDDEISPTTARITQKSAGCHRKSSTTGGGRLTEKDGIGGR